jgi:AcrR family transcriptional regulator
MKNKELQDQRMKGYFLQATKELLKAEGLQSVNVRNIAERAGYSYATLYNYFKDINDLIFLCVHDFYEECAQHVRDHTRKQERGFKRLRASVKAYADFFVQYPGIFSLFFTEDFGSFKDKEKLTDVIELSLDKVCEEEWNYCVARGVVEPERVTLIKSQIRYAVLGLLLLYIQGRASFAYPELVSRINTQLDAVLQGYEGSDRPGGSLSIHNSIISFKIN